MNLEQFIEKFSEIRRMSFVESRRRGPTGIGKTLEDLLGITENNIALPDFGNLELKAHRLSSTNLITLFTFNRKVWKMNPLEAVRKYGTLDSSGRKGLYFTMSRVANSMDLFLFIDSEAVSVRHVSGEILAEWNLTALAEQFMKKIPAVVFVSAQVEIRAGNEWFHYTRAKLLKDTSPDILKDQIAAGNVLIDLRLHDTGTSARNHGTGFRINPENMHLLYRDISEL